MGVGGTFGNLSIVRQFMRGIYNVNPPKPRYSGVWDPQIVLDFLVKWSPARKISIKKLTLKTVMLILLVTGQRGQIIKALNTDAMEVSSSRFVFYISNKDLKQGRPGYRPEPIKLRAFPGDKRLCVHRYLVVYLERTLENRGKEKSVFLTFSKPYRAATRDTVSRWVKTVLKLAGIDITKYGPGSTRAAAVSKAEQQGAPVDDILKAGGWTRQSTFQKFYKKTVVKEQGIDEYVLRKGKKREN